MKKLSIILICATIFPILISACSRTPEKHGNMKKKSLVVYFSLTGNTERAARRIAAKTDADIIEILPLQPYTDADIDWNDENSRSSRETRDQSSRPEIRQTDKNAGDYDIIFIGYPIWWDLAPKVINTFIERNNLKGKTVVPFATSGSSGIAHSAAELKKQYPDINWSTPLLFNNISDSKVDAWLKSINYAL